MKLSRREQVFFDKATAGGLSIEDAFAVVYSHKTKNILMTDLRRKRRHRPELFQAIDSYKMPLQAKDSFPVSSSFLERYAREGEINTEVDLESLAASSGTWNNADSLPTATEDERALESKVDFSTFLQATFNQTRQQNNK